MTSTLIPPFDTFDKSQISNTKMKEAEELSSSCGIHKFVLIKQVL